MIIIDNFYFKNHLKHILKFLPHKRCNLIIFPFAQMSSGIKIWCAQMKQSISWALSYKNKTTQMNKRTKHQYKKINKSDPKKKGSL
jgi:ADP-heptose:LPS heptosyltransferase